MKQIFVMTLTVLLLAIAVPFGVLITAQVRSGSSTDSENGNTGEGPANGEGRSEQSETQAGGYGITGPYTHKNLTIFLLHGKDLIEGKVPLTLQEALEQKKVVVYETKDVNELSIENLSNEDVYVQSGDIVKGGQQDRLIAVDLIVPPKSGRMPIAAFCVEQGRWSKRGNEQAAVFSSSADAAATKNLKLAAKRENSQSGVWENVTVAQDKLSENLRTTVNASESVSSLQLAVENRKVQESVAGYTKALLTIVTGKADVIGYAFTINGELNSADVYASTALFKKLWPKLLKANAVEAIAELRTGDKFEPATVAQVRTFLDEAESGKAAEKDITARIRLLTRDDGKNIFFETRDRAKEGVWIHRNYIKK